MALTEQEILAGVGKIINEITGIPADEVTPEKSFVDDLDIDSLSMVEIAIAAQDEFGVEIPDDKLKDLKTVKDVIGFIQGSKSAHLPALTRRFARSQQREYRPGTCRRHRARRDNASRWRRRLILSALPRRSVWGPQSHRRLGRLRPSEVRRSRRRGPDRGYCPDRSRGGLTAPSSSR